MDVGLFLLVGGSVAVPMSVFYVIFCIVSNKGAPKIMLSFFLSMIGVVALIGLGGAAVLKLFGMGWRRTPANFMIEMCIGFFIAALCCCIWQLIALKDKNTAFKTWGSVFIVIAILVTLQLGRFHFLVSPEDELRVYNDETIVCVHVDPGSAHRRYYTHINGLVRGAEIAGAGWGETRPLD